MHGQRIMDASARHSPRRGLLPALALALVTAFIVALPAAAFNAGWTKPKLVFKYTAAPTHSMVTDGNAKVHIAAERGGGGVWYITNAHGSWQQCQVSDGNDRQPSIAVSGGMVYIAFARGTDGEKGILVASADQPVPPGDCDWSTTERYSGSASYPSMGFHAGKLSIAFRTGDKKLKFIKGGSADADWGSAEVIDGKCCTSPVVLELTASGAPRVAFGDGTSKADGLKFAVRTTTKWKKSKLHSGRVSHVDMVLDKTPGLFGEPPSNSPKIVYVVKRKGLFVATKGGGQWTKRGFGKKFGPVQISHHSNLTRIVYTARGNLTYLRASGGIWASAKLSGGGSDGKPQLHGDALTFSRKAATKGVFFSRPK